MISDVLYDAVDEIDTYLADDRHWYAAEWAVRICAVRNAMDAMRGELDNSTGTPRALVDLVVAADKVVVNDQLRHGARQEGARP